MDEYRTTQEERLKTQSKRAQASSGLLITGLQKRLLSSIEAFAHTLNVHRGTVRRRWEAFQQKQAKKIRKENEALNLDLLHSAVGGDDERAEYSEEQLQDEQDAQVTAASEATVFDDESAAAKVLWDKEQELLDRMSEIAEASRTLPDAKVQKLLDWVQENMCPEMVSATTDQPAKWNSTRVIIFTEWEDTKRYLHRQLAAAIANTENAQERIALFSGPTSEDRRAEIKRAFNADPETHPVRILIATESAREGLNLQAHCSNLFHFDVPWNPSRLEQRNGRIDRKLQPEDKVYCHYFYYKQRPEDRVLKKLIEKTKTIREQLGSLSQVIDARLDKTMALGIRRSGIAELEVEIDETDIDADDRQVMEEELEASRERQEDLREQIDRLRGILDTSKKSIGLNEDLFRLAISSSLEILGAEPLAPHIAGGKSKGPERLTFPAIEQRDWDDTLDTLRTPKERGQKPWEWRRDSEIRPVVFEDPGELTDEVVHLHLEHRIVQRLLGRFTAQGFVLNDISRACLAHTKDAVPRVALLGRLALYGSGAARLHEQLIPVTARWTDPRDRKEPLSPYARTAETTTMALLDEAFQKTSGRTIEKEVAQRLQETSAQDVQELLEHLQHRGQEFAADAEQKLTERGEAEAKAMIEILERQQKHIRKTRKDAEKGDWRQLRINFQGEAFDVEAEKRQLDANKRYWEKRLEVIKQELKTEPQRIRDIYSVRATRIEPVGLVYLWPVTG